MANCGPARMRARLASAREFANRARSSACRCARTASPAAPIVSRSTSPSTPSSRRRERALRACTSARRCCSAANSRAWVSCRCCAASRSRRSCSIAARLASASAGRPASKPTSAASGLASQRSASSSSTSSSSPPVPRPSRTHSAALASSRRRVCSAARRSPIQAWRSGQPVMRASWERSTMVAPSRSSPVAVSSRRLVRWSSVRSKSPGWSVLLRSEAIGCWRRTSSRPSPNCTSRSRTRRAVACWAGVSSAMVASARRARATWRPLRPGEPP